MKRPVIYQWNQMQHGILLCVNEAAGSDVMEPGVCLLKKAHDIARRERGTSRWCLICVVGGGEGAASEGVRHLERPPHRAHVCRKNLI